MHRLDKRTLIERLFELINERDLDTLGEIFEESHVAHTPWGDVAGIAEFKQFLQVCWLGPFPDAEFQISHIVIDRDLAAWQGRFTGTNNGGISPAYLESMPACRDALSRWSLMGMPPTGRRVDVVGLYMSRFSASDRQVESWTGNDQLVILQQLNLLPGARGAPALG